MAALLTDVFSINQDVARQLVLDAEAPALLIRSLVPTLGAKWTVGAETYIVQQPKRVACGLNQPEGKRIIEVHERSRVVGWIYCDHVRILIETSAAVRDDTSDA